MTAQFAFDTLAFVKRLSAAGMEARQAEALAEALTAHAFDDLVMKSDLKSALQELELRLTMRMGAMTAASTVLTVAILGAMITLS
ncbi:MAG TPA: hypothetical protein VK403_08550 [Allosphingosinicella sp.]|nr:hypothetical protein [Allosphingosinicella sp.]